MEEEDQGGDGSDTEEEEDTDTLSAEWETVSTGEILVLYLFDNVF